MLEVSDRDFDTATLLKVKSLRFILTSCIILFLLSTYVEVFNMVCLADSFRIADQSAGQSKADEMVLTLYSEGAYQGMYSCAMQLIM